MALSRRSPVAPESRSSGQRLSNSPHAWRPRRCAVSSPPSACRPNARRPGRQPATLCQAGHPRATCRRWSPPRRADPTRLDPAPPIALPAKLMLGAFGTRDLTLTPARGRLRIPAVARPATTACRSASARSSLAVAPAQCRTVDDVCRMRGSGASPSRSMRCARPATAASATPPALPSSPRRRRAGCRRHLPQPDPCPVHRRSGALRPLFALEPPVPQPAARRPRAACSAETTSPPPCGGRPAGELRPARSRRA